MAARSAFAAALAVGPRLGFEQGASKTGWFDFK